MTQINVIAVCKANYCRSPVAEYFLREFLDASFNVRSAGLIHFSKTNMDKRSQNFLKKNGFEEISHIPKALTKQIVNQSTLIFAMDRILLEKIKSKFPEAHNKVQLMNNTSIDDPINLKSEEDYEKIMSKIKINSKITAEKLTKLISI
tara:strand:+ start:8863 stop:9306 length:444 start_codon:yes stop_codon:yes gene_type:complete